MSGLTHEKRLVASDYNEEINKLQKYFEPDHHCPQYVSSDALV
jgi:hypothetical protein